MPEPTLPTMTLMTTDSSTELKPLLGPTPTTVIQTETACWTGSKLEPAPS